MDRSDRNPEQFSFARLEDKRTAVLKSGSLWREKKKASCFQATTVLMHSLTQCTIHVCETFACMLKEKGFPSTIHTRVSHINA